MGTTPAEQLSSPQQNSLRSGQGHPHAGALLLCLLACVLCAALPPVLVSQLLPGSGFLSARHALADSIIDETSPGESSESGAMDLINAVLASDEPDYDLEADYDYSELGVAVAVLEEDGTLYFIRTQADLEELASLDSAEDSASALYILEGPLQVDDRYGVTYEGAIFSGFEDSIYRDASEVPWSGWTQEILAVQIKDEIQPRSCAWWFAGCTALASVEGVLNLDGAQLEILDGMFSGCSSLTELDLGHWNLPEAGSMAYMFEDCSSLATLNLSGLNAPLLSDVASMFDGCASLSALTLPNMPEPVV